MQIKETIMHIFDYSFLDEGLLPAEIVNLTSAIAAFNAISGTRKENTSTVETVLGKLVKTGTVFANVWEGF